MSQARFNSALNTRKAVNVRAFPTRAKRSVAVVRQELEVKLADLQQNYADLYTQIFEAAQVHRRLCAPRHVRFGNFEVASEIFAVRHLPGDFFTVTEKSDGVVMALGDISGKGLAAGMWTTHLVGLVGARVAVTSNPEAIVAGVNRDICLLKSFMPLASLFLLKLDPITGLVRYCSAGHPPALLLRANGELELLTEGGMLLGVVASTPYVSGTFELGVGDVLMVYSDGINESVNCAGEEFGYERLEAQLRAAQDNAANGTAQASAADAMLFSVLGAVQDFAAASPLVDDMTLGIIRRDSH
ncbi:MAG TPA: PP2C family protein-serine/threonine phosphatase [Pyrinomonadaceae bacterium]|nr:PP2C family protein-serine/threonine phosphatase [Pyrinomonadaceae bacterium]